MKYDWLELPAKEKDSWLQLCPPNTFRVVAPTEISGLLPDSLVKKYESVVILSSGVRDSDAVVFMANGYRVDAKKSEIDQMPFGFGYLSGGGTTSGLLIQHASWTGCTIKPPDDFWNHIQQSGIGTCFPLPVLPSQKSGHISELQSVTQLHPAFTALIDGLKSQYSELMT